MFAILRHELILSVFQLLRWFEYSFGLAHYYSYYTIVVILLLLLSLVLL